MLRILHIDGDSFFASVETSLNPKLKGKPVVTGEERGIATAMSKEAKVLGIHRGMPIFQIRKLYPQAIVVNSNYHAYRIFAERMYNIVRRYADRVQEYSIDECFGDLTDVSDTVNAARLIKHDLQQELAMTFSLGVAPTKTLAKVASKWNKPDGFTVLEHSDINHFLHDLQIGKVWGIGPASSRHFNSLGIKTALDFIEKPEQWIRENLDKHAHELWCELRGEKVFHLHTHDDLPCSIQKTRTFTPPTADKQFILSELSYNLENACSRARSERLLARRMYFFIKTQEFRYFRQEILLPHALQTPSEILKLISKTFDNVYKPGYLYRASGVTLSELVPEMHLQEDLFGDVNKNKKIKKIFKTIDRLERRYGSHTIILGSSMHAMKRRGKKIDFRKAFSLPFLGEVV